ncbi:MAG: DUF1385 domain-containing protein [Lachnospiraceae bacterium]|nr:DUF1385 domain-containing protein [Lachnospiraceae bacterium]
MSYSGIGGQAVMEGVMMRNGRDYATAVRLPDKSIHVEKRQTRFDGTVINKIPLARGVFSFVYSLYLGLSTLMYSASFFEEEEAKPKNEKSEGLQMAGILTLSFVMAMALFMALPFYASRIFSLWTDSPQLLALLEGIIRILVFLAYIWFIGRTEDIRRVFMYHGAEHKCINCIEHGLPLTVENVRKSSRQHKRCGTSFLFVVLLISVFVFMFIRSDSRLIQLLLRLVLVPAIAAISYEFIRLAGKSENACVNLLSKPGLALQNMTTREPDDDMIEVGMAAVEAVFDWRDFQAREKGDGECHDEGCQG